MADETGIQGNEPESAPTSGEAQTPEQQAAAEDAKGLAAFMEKMSAAGVPGAKPAEPVAAPEAEQKPSARGKDGKFQSRSGQGSEDGENPEGARTVAMETDKDLEAAIHALRRAHYSSEMIEGLGDDAAIKKFAAPLVKQFGDSDRAHTKVRELEKALEEASKAMPSEGNGTAPQAPPVAQPDPAALDKVKASLSNAFGETDAEVLMEAIGASTGQASFKVAALEASLEQANQTLAQVQGVVFEMQMEAVRREAQGRIPGLADNENWQTVRAQLSKLNPDAYRDASLGDMVVDAARMLGLGGQAGDVSRRRTSDLNTLKDAGRTATPTTAAPAAATKDPGLEAFIAAHAKHGLV